MLAYKHGVKSKETNMALKVEVFSKEIIRPSTPTPLHLKTLNLSLLDQYIPAEYIPIIFFYSAKNAELGKETRLDHLKKSLSEILTDFYPLAGRINGNKFIDCNDEGVNFIETQVSGPLSYVIAHPEPDQLSQLLPSVDNTTALLSIQANQFECGGLAIAVRMFHTLGDASSVSLFVDHWAAVARGERKSVCPKFGTAPLFPPQDESLSPPESSVSLPSPNLVSKRFVFDAASISAIKAKISNDCLAVPTRVEAVSALMWRCAINAARMKTGDIKSESVMCLAVNFRGRMVPPLSKFWFGNLILCTLARTHTENNPELPSLVVKLQEAVRRVDSSFTGQLQTPEGFFAYLHPMLEVFEKSGRGEWEFHVVSSWCRFPFYEADFGWGEPVWVTYAYFWSKNQIVLMDTKCGQGVEAWVTLDEEDMARFECEPELKSYSSTDETENS